MALRVLMASTFPRRLIRGGIEAATAELVAALGRRDDLDVHVAAQHHTISRPEQQRVAPNVTLHWLPRWRHLSTLQLLSVAAAQVALLERRIRPDVLHAQGATPLAASAWQSRRSLALTVHGLEMLGQDGRQIERFSGPVGRMRRTLATAIIDLSL